MSMFQGLANEIKSLNSDVKTVANCQKAKKLKTQLLAIGIPVAVLGFGGVLTCLILFITSFGSIDPFAGFTARTLVPFILFIPCAIVGMIGLSLTSLGLKIVITGYTTNLVDETVGNICPNCKDKIEQDEMFCSNCGQKVKKECPNCKAINSIKDKFCTKCGQELED